MKKPAMTWISSSPKPAGKKLVEKKKVDEVPTEKKPKAGKKLPKNAGGDKKKKNATKSIETTRSTFSRC
ncbi:Histone H2B [Capsicum annuum]|uniref:Histone H2B n=1 Tax=Capsicum annuum TaxID=4072 RepID=A0A2G3A7A9_CAPAN|nr:Histone H2B [Capsicum annuum]KAF3641533.1 Histone H2B [Capsicum annuum]PHT90149.1 Histone H2B [Capsicum annuum]